MSAYLDAATDALVTRVFDTDGRISRIDYVWLIIAACIFYVAAVMLALIPFLNLKLEPFAICVWVTIALITGTIRRLHDINKSVSFLLVPLGIILVGILVTHFLIPLLGLLIIIGAYIFFIVMLFTKGSTGTNKFGPEYIAPFIKTYDDYKI